MANPELAEKAFAHLSHQLFSEWIALRTSPTVQAAVHAALHSQNLRAKAVELADDLGDPAYGADLLAIAKSQPEPEDLRAAAVGALGHTRDASYAAELQRLYTAGPMAIRVAAVRATGDTAPAGLDAKLQRLILSQEPNEVRSAAVRVLARTKPGLNSLLDLQQHEQLPVELKNVATTVVNSSRDPEIRKRAAKLLPPLTSSNKMELPPISQLVWRTGDVPRGHKVFLSEAGPKCSGCHSVGGKKKIGPDLAAIGSKLGKDGLYDAILNPSAGIAPDYYMWVLETKTQGDVIGIIKEDTPERVVVRTDATTDVRLKPAEIKSRRRSHLSLMPEDLMNYMTEQQLVDVVEYLTTLKKSTPSARLLPVRGGAAVSNHPAFPGTFPGKYKPPA
jgi:putative heme-binding domain-containing protein